jgi:glycine/D-amino acid oxidase-like deaminating enzyme
MEVEFLIVGSGIAGITLALELQQRGKSIAILDDANQNNSSRIAAGLMNPIVPKRVTKTWLCDEIFPALSSYYSHWENILGNEFYQGMEFIQIHASAAECNEWAYKSEILGNYLNQKTIELPSFIQTTFGYTNILQAGKINVASFIDAALNFLKNKAHVIKAKLNYQELEITANATYKFNGILSEKIIFCEGANGIHNPWFRYLPFNLSSGDILTLQIPELKNEKRIFKQRAWLLPLKDDIFLAGSTFHTNNIYADAKKEDAEEIVSNIRKWLKADIKIMDHKKGVRPTVKNRRPFLGEHPKQKNMYIFNGLGTKGSSLVTWLAPRMADFLTMKLALQDEINIQKMKL